MKILSLFDGMSCGYEALTRAGIPVDKYYASEIDKYAIQIALKNHPDIEEIGDVTKVKGEDYKDIDLLIGGSPCFVKGTNVFTENGYVDISEIQEGDNVIGIDGQYNKVVKVGGQEKNIWSIKGQGFLETLTTENHPYLVSKCVRKGNKCVRTLEKQGWKQVKDIVKGDYVGLPIIKEESNEFNITEQEARLIGRYVADGHTRKDFRENVNRYWSVIFSIGDNKVKDFDFIDEYHCGIHKHTQSTHRVAICSKRLVELCEMAGCGAINKCIPNYILNLPKDILIKFFEGYMSGDGFHKDNGEWKATTISKELAMGFCLLSAKLFNTGAQIHFLKKNKTHVIQGRVVNQHDVYEIIIREIKRKQDHYMVEWGYIWLPVKEVKQLGYKDMVYNIEVENTHSYTANNIVVHNCQGFSLAGKQLNFEDPRSKLFFEYVRILKEIKPKYFLLENVKMKKEYQDIISKELGVEPVEINSALLSAQNRKRLYRVGKLVGDKYEQVMIPQPKDKGILLKDILEDEVDEKYNLTEKGMQQLLRNFGAKGKILGSKDIKSNTLTASMGTGGGNVPAITYAPSSREFRQQGWKIDKSPTLLARDYKDPKIVALPCATQLGQSSNFGTSYGSQKAYTLRASNPNGVIQGCAIRNQVTKDGMETQLNIRKDEKSNCVVSSYTDKLNQCTDGIMVRKLTPIECERLQTMPDNYTEGVSNTQRYKMLGNGWTCDVIVYIFSFLK